MATPKGIIGFEGTIGGISFYMRKGKPCARKAGGPSKEMIATSKKCKRTRENNAEFKGAVAASKFLRLGLNPFIKNFADWNISGRLNGVFRKIIDRANGVRGERPLQVLPNKDLLIGFNLNKEISFDTMFEAPFSAYTNAFRNELTLVIPDFDTTTYIQSVSGASHFRIVNAITVLPKFIYDPLAKQYFSSDGMLEGLNHHELSEYIPLQGNVGSDIILTTTLSGSTIINPDSGLVFCIGIEFYQEVSGNKYLLQSGSSMKICTIF